MLAFLLLLLAVVGLNTLLWTTAGIVRVVAHRVNPAPAMSPHRLVPKDVAILIAAHNEELTIRETIRSAFTQVGPGQVYIASDGSTDRTAAVARRYGAAVVELSPNRGKAGALVAGIHHFALADRFQAVMLLDADTQLAPDYMATGLPLFDDEDVVAVAGRATTLRDPRPPTWIGRVLVAYRERVYVVMQYLFKFGQAGRFANVVAIVPGFASMYRTRILDQVDIAAKGLAIEDYNMTFEVHAKELGRIAFHPGAAIAHTQDPDRLHDYLKQVRRWNLGFWQTVKRHGFKPRRFWFALVLFVPEVVVSSISMVLVGPLLVVTGGTAAAIGLGVDVPAPLPEITGVLPPWAIAAGVLIPDAVLTVFTVGVTRRWRDLLVAPAFPVVRVLDAIACLRALLAALVPRAGGVWTSPSRRPVSRAT